MGSFKKTTGWASQAIQLVAGSITVDYALLDASLAVEYQRAEARQRKKWANKRNNTTSISPVREAMFMMYFECPAAPSDKGGKPREYLVAMSHIDQTTVTLIDTTVHELVVSIVMKWRLTLQMGAMEKPLYI